MYIFMYMNKYFEEAPTNPTGHDCGAIHRHGFLKLLPAYVKLRATKNIYRSEIASRNPPALR